MKIIEKMSLRDFKFWSGGKDRACNLTDEQFAIVEDNFEQLFPEGMTDVEVNDMFWFDFDTIAQWLGYEDEAHFDANVREDDVDEAEEWLDSLSDEDEMVTIADLDINRISYDEDGSMDFDQVYDLFQNWWNNLSDIEKVKAWRSYSEL